MSKKLVICFDGTWNKKSADPGDENDTNTNVVKMADSIATSDSQPPVMYDQGVGSRWYDKVLGGAIGFGIDLNIMQGYAWLSDNFEDGDDIYLFGFSRGAYTARSLAGFIHLCGLLSKADGFHVTTAYEKYRHPSLAGPAADLLLRQTRPAPIKFIGVWDTVGALGIPTEMDNGFDQKIYAFHDVALHDDVEYAYHAVAVDEHRDIFNVTMWDPPADSPTKMEQRWFVGAHADVGGGYADLRQWPQYTLRWMQEKAQACGLDLTLVDAPTLDFGQGIHDSLAEFMDGRFAKFVAPLFRPILQTSNGNEVIDASVKDKMAKDSGYRPQNAGLS